MHNVLGFSLSRSHIYVNTEKLDTMRIQMQEDKNIERCPYTVVVMIFFLSPRALHPPDRPYNRLPDDDHTFQLETLCVCEFSTLILSL